MEALTSIYGKEWCVVDEASRVYCIDVEGGEETPRLKIALRVCKSFSSVQIRNLINWSMN